MKLFKVFTEITSTVFLALIIALFINFFIIQPSTVFGRSMEPTLHEGDFIFISKIINTFDIEPDYETIVIIDSHVEHKHNLRDDILFALKYNKISHMLFQQLPEDRYWIKRVVGKAGDHIEFKDNQLYRNGELLTESYINEDMRNVLDFSLVVPEKHIYVLGDNRNHSADSRIIGSVPIENVLGKLLYKL